MTVTTISILTDPGACQAAEAECYPSRPVRRDVLLARTASSILTGGGLRPAPFSQPMTGPPGAAGSGTLG
jgi:hypothetical protein